MMTLLSLLTLIAFALLSGPATAAEPTPVNGQITDSVTQTDEKTDEKAEGDAPAMAMGNLYKPTSQAEGNAAHNATNAQQDANGEPENTKTDDTKAPNKEQ